jgi:hypothetical protein
LVVVVVLMAIVATVITLATAVIVRTAGPTNTRADEARTLHGLNTWLGRDAAAAAPGDFDLAAAAGTNCTSGSPGVNLVRMDWTEDTGTAVNYVSSYRYVDQGSGEFRIERHACSGSGAGPYGGGTSLNLTGDLSSTSPTVTAVLNASLQTIGVSIEVFSLEGASILVDGDSRNPSVTLPPATVPPGPCSLITLSAAPNPITNQGSGVKRLSTDVTVSITMAGTCGTVTLQYDRGDGAGPQTEGVTGTFPSYTVILEGDHAQPWSEASHVLTVYDDATALAPTTNLVVT